LPFAVSARCCAAAPAPSIRYEGEGGEEEGTGGLGARGELLGGGGELERRLRALRLEGGGLGAHGGDGGVDLGGVVPERDTHHGAEVALHRALRRVVAAHERGVAAVGAEGLGGLHEVLRVGSERLEAVEEAALLLLAVERGRDALARRDEVAHRARHLARRAAQRARPARGAVERPKRALQPLGALLQHLRSALAVECADERARRRRKERALDLRLVRVELLQRRRNVRAAHVRPLRALHRAQQARHAVLHRIRI
jgi:hypothetical protein